jgi:hypothetical protein
MQNILRHPYVFAFVSMAVFALSVALGAAPEKLPTELLREWAPFVAKGLLTIAFLVLAAWFIDAFTLAEASEARAGCVTEQRASMFRFAYVFSIFSFALLVLPFTALLRDVNTSPDAGPIRLLRACVDIPSSSRAASAPSPIELCNTMPADSVVSYPWLVAVGGVVAQCENGSASCAKVAGVAAAASAPQGPPIYRVHGGLVVPFYVIVFAFIGGVVNLTRRLPEYQKRSSCQFPGTGTESRVTFLEAREFVIFQIMQFVSSPFVAMVAYYAFEPKSVASAVGVAFFSGFATESILLLLRGMFAGLQPVTTKTVASTAATAQLHVTVNRPAASGVAGGPADKCTVEIRHLPAATPPLETRTTGADGVAEFKAASPGTVWVVATLAVPGGSVLSASQKLQLEAGRTEALVLTLA